VKHPEKPGTVNVPGHPSERLALDDLPMPAATTHLAEVPEDGFAEWLDVKLPVAEAISA